MTVLTTALLFLCGVQPAALFAEDVPDAEVLPTAQAHQNDRTIAISYLTKRDFARLDARADELRRKNARFRNGLARLDTFYRALGYPDVATPSDADFEQRIELLEEWARKNPQSQAARLALADVWASWGFHARGGGWASSVSEDQFQQLRERCLKSQSLLDEIEEQFEDPDVYYYVVRISVMRGLGIRPDPQLAYEAIERDPFEMSTTEAMASCLLPRWFGEPGELEDFMDSVVERTQEAAGERQYTTMALSLFKVYGEQLFDVHDIEWERVKRGARDWKRHFPIDARSRYRLALMAVCAKDVEAAREFIPPPEENGAPTVPGSEAGLEELRSHVAEEQHAGDHDQLVINHFAPLLALDSLDLSPDANMAFTLNVFHVGRITDRESGRTIWTHKWYGPGRPTIVAVGWKNQILALGSSQAPHLSLFDLRSNQAVGVELIESTPQRLEFSDDSRYLAVVEKKADISIIDLETSQRLQKFGPADRLVVGLAFSPDSSLLAASTGNGQILVFDVATGEQTAELNIGPGPLYCLAWSPLGNRLAAASKRNLVRVWSWPERELLGEWTADIGAPASLAFSPNGQRLAVGFRKPGFQGMIDHPVRLWNYADNDEVITLRGHRYGVTAVGWASDDELVTVSYDWTMRTWKVPARDE